MNAVCLLSGGPDSVIAALLQRRDGASIQGLFVDYGQRNASAEIEHARRTATWLKVDEFRVARVPFLREVGGSAMTSETDRVDVSKPRGEYVPFRNTVLLSLATAWAEAAGYERVVCGSIGGPWITPDNSPAYYSQFNALIQEGTLSPVEALAPLNGLSKTEVIALGLELGVPFELTWSCQNDEDVPCLRCNNCLDRQRAFASLGVEDPLIGSNLSTTRAGHSW